MARLAGRAALVTGASRGIGRAIAVELAREGAEVVVNYQANAAKAQGVVDEIVAAGGRAASFQADVSRSAEARGLVAWAAERCGRLDILVNNAGITRDCTLKKMTDEQWEQVVQTNLNAYFYCMSAAVPVMLAQKYGRIVNVTSLNGQIAAFGQANYSAAKGGVIALTRTAALELAHAGITVNGVAPGFTDTDMFAEVPDKIKQQILARIPLARFGQPVEVAKAVVYLAADADYVTGQQINVNGGAFMG